jgi:ATP-dependent DNA ligase
MRLEGIVNKRKGSLYRSGRSHHWVKAKNPSAPAVTRPDGRRLETLIKRHSAVSGIYSRAALRWGSHEGWTAPQRVLVPRS